MAFLYLLWSRTSTLMNQLSLLVRMRQERFTLPSWEQRTVIKDDGDNMTFALTMSANILAKLDTIITLYTPFIQNRTKKENLKPTQNILLLKYLLSSKRVFRQLKLTVMHKNV